MKALANFAETLGAQGGPRRWMEASLFFVRAAQGMARGAAGPRHPDVWAVALARAGHALRPRSVMEEEEATFEVPAE